MWYTFDSLANLWLINIETFGYQLLRKNEFLRNIWLSVHLFNQIIIQTTFLEIYANLIRKMIRNGMALCQFTCSSWSNTNSCRCTAMNIHHLNRSCQEKNRLTWTVSYSNKALMTFNHDPPNSLISGINFLEFLVLALSITNSHRW